MNKRKYKEFEEFLIEDLKDPKKAAAYIKTTLEDKEFDSLPQVLALVAKAHGITKLSKASGLAREHIYQLLGKGANPTLKSISELLNAMGLEIMIAPKKHA